MRRALGSVRIQSVPALPGIVILTLPEIPRNAERTQRAKAALHRVHQRGPVGEKIRSGRRGGCPDQILKQKPASKDHVVIPSVAGCTTGYLCPRCPYRRDEVLSLYSKPRFCLRWPHYSRWHGTSVLHSTMCPKAHNMVCWRRYPK
jgi:hypothetical protein